MESKNDVSMVRILMSEECDAKIRKTAETLGVEKETLLRAMIEGGVANAILLPDDQNSLRVYSQSEWTKYVCETTIELGKKGADESVVRSVKNSVVLH